MSLTRIISGGQTGVDRGAQDAALDAGFPTGGWCPPGRKAEDGPIDARYPVVEMREGGYAERTTQNVIDSDGTVVIYFQRLSGGSKWTHRQCRARGKPVLLVDAEESSELQAFEAIVGFVAQHQIQTLNVAGPRQSSAPRAREFAHRVIGRVIAAARLGVELGG